MIQEAVSQNEKRFSRLAIASFIFAIVAIVYNPFVGSATMYFGGFLDIFTKPTIRFLGGLLNNDKILWYVYGWLVRHVSLFLYITSVVLGILALMKISKNPEKKGKIFSWIGIILSGGILSLSLFNLLLRLFTGRWL